MSAENFRYRIKRTHRVLASVVCALLGIAACGPAVHAQNLVPLRGVTQVSAGFGHACALTTQGSVKCWGNNEYGELGDGTTTDRSTPVDVLGLSSGVTAVAAGSGHTCVLMAAGGVKCWGDNESGQLGDGTTTDRTTPVNVFGLSQGVTAITASGHTCALTSVGGIKCWGNNGGGWLGDGTTTMRTTPVDVVGLTSGASSISAGADVTCALVGNGAKCWGANYDGQVGDGSLTDRYAPVDVQGLGTGITAVSAGFRHACAVTAAGGVKCWGDNAWYALGDTGFGQNYSVTPLDVTGLGGVTALNTNWGDTHACAITASYPAGLVTCWGEYYFQVGNVYPFFSIGRYDQFVDAVSLSTGVELLQNFVCAVTTEGGVKCLGGDSYGELGNGSTSNSYVAAVVDVMIPDDTIFKDGFGD